MPAISSFVGYESWGWQRKASPLILILTPRANREASTDQADTIGSSSPVPITSTPDSGLSTLSRSSPGTPRRNDTPKLTNPVQDMFSRVFSSNSERRGGRPIVSSSPESPREPSTAQSTLEREGSYHEIERLSRRSHSQSSVGSSFSSVGANEMVSSPLVRPEMSERRVEIIQSNCHDEDSAPSSVLVCAKSHLSSFGKMPARSYGFYLCKSIDSR